MAHSLLAAAFKILSNAYH